MAEKKGAGGKPQLYDTADGEYLETTSDGSTQTYNENDGLQDTERKHNSDGFGGEHKATPAESQRLQELGIESFGQIIDTKLKEHKPLSDSEIDEVLSILAETYEKPEKNIGDKNLKKILEINGFSGVPKRVNKKELTNVIAEGTVLFRGLNGENAKEYGKQFYDGEMFVGLGLGGNGVYMSVDGNEANSYAKGSSVVVAAVMPKEMKIAGKEVRQEYQNFYNLHKTTSEQTPKEKERLWAMQKPLSFGTYCALKGYDAYLPTINPEKNMVVLNRSKLVIGENNEQERLLELS